MSNEETYGLDRYQSDAARTLGDHPREYGALSLAGETGEVVELIKKAVFHGKGLDLGKLSEELGDVLWSVAAIAEQNDLSLAEIAHSNIEKLTKRYPSGFTKGGGVRHDLDDIDFCDFEVAMRSAGFRCYGELAVSGVSVWVDDLDLPYGFAKENVSFVACARFSSPDTGSKLIGDVAFQDKHKEAIMKVAPKAVSLIESGDLVALEGVTGNDDPRLLLRGNRDAVVIRDGRKIAVHRKHDVEPGDKFVAHHAHQDGSFAYTCFSQYCRCMS